ncbi:MAG: ribonuclease Z [Bacteroidales bacterium]|nr:ribonuclease Z [Bacteroides sp.]MCM1198350.1 ribonuclease Z [Clostridium sp.]MCM1503008.1 ribonuclease Z [Bacteroidales bacterium]
MPLQHSRTSSRKVSNFTLRILGTASALPTVNRNPSAQVLDVRGRLFLIDCGEGVQISLRKAGVSFLKIDNICISHIHGDHIFGIFGLLSTMGMLGRSTPLHIYAPRSFAPIMKFFFAYFGEGFHFRVEHHVLSMKSPEVVFSSKSVEMLAFPLNHRIETFGFIIREKMPMMNIRKEAIGRYGLTLAEIGTLKRGEDVVRESGEIIQNAEAAYRPFEPRSYAYCSDTAPFPELPGWVSGVDLLYHESTFPEDMSDMAAKTHHSTTVQAAKCALDAGAGRLVVGHYSSRFPDVTPFLEEIRPIFPEAALAKEGDVFEIPEKLLP